MKKLLFIFIPIMLFTASQGFAQTEAYKQKEAVYCFVYPPYNDMNGTKILYITGALSSGDYLDPTDSYNPDLKLRTAFRNSYSSDMGDKGIFTAAYHWRGSTYGDFSHNDDGTFKSEQDALDCIRKIKDQYTRQGYTVQRLAL